MHSLLRRQIKQFFGGDERVPADLRPLLHAIDATYLGFDQDRVMLERSLELSSAELLQANADNRAIFQALPDRFFRLDADGTIVDERRSSRDGAWLTESTVGRRLQELLPPAGADQFDAGMQRVRDGGAQFRFECSRTSDEAAVFEARLLPLPGTQTIAIVRNVTAEAKAERERERSLSLLKATLESTDDGILVVDRLGSIVDYNRQFIEMWRLPELVQGGQVDERLIARVVDQLIDPNAFVQRVLELHDDPGAIISDVVEFKDGRVFQRYSQPQVVGGQFVGRVWSFYDVTALRRAQEETAKQREYFSEVLDRLPSVVFAKDSAGRLVLVNEAMAALFNATSDVLLGKTLTELAPGAAALDHGDVEVLAEPARHYTTEEPVSDGSGNVRWFQTNKRAIPAPGGTGLQVLAVSTDITERKRAEEALRGRTEHLIRKHATLHELALLNAESLDGAIAHIAASAARMMNVARVGLWFFDANETAIVCRHLHADGEPAFGTGTRLAAADYPRYFAALTEGRVVAVADARQDPRTSEFTDGYLVPLGVTSMLDVPIRRDGRMVGLVCYEHTGPVRGWTLEDEDAASSVADFISVAFEADKRRLLEDQLRQSQKMEAIGLLAGGVAHDFNNLLGVITGYAEIVSEGLPENDGSRDDCQKIITAANCAADLTRKLLAFSKRQILQVKLYDLNNILGEFSRMLNRIVGEDVEVRITRHGEPLTVKADAGQIEQVLLNLCSNSRQAMRDGGSLFIQTSRLDLTAAQAQQRSNAPPGPYAVLTVTDTGPGMDEATLARIFEPFFTTKAQGTGLGLATVYGIVQQHNGFIDVASAPGQGTTFTIHLPLQAAQPTVQDAGVTSHKPRGGTETILIAEDEPMLRSLMAESLGHLGYQVTTVPDGEAAVRAFEREPAAIDLVILDTVMPRMSGADAYTQMRAIRPDVKAIFISGYATDGARLTELLETERLSFIQKPFSPKVVAAKVREVLETPSRRVA